MRCGLTDHEKCVLLALIYNKEAMGTAEIKNTINESEINKKLTYQRVRYYLKQLKKHNLIEEKENLKFWITQKGSDELSYSRELLNSMSF